MKNREYNKGFRDAIILAAVFLPVALLGTKIYDDVQDLRHNRENCPKLEDNRKATKDSLKSNVNDTYFNTNNRVFKID